MERKNVDSPSSVGEVFRVDSEHGRGLIGMALRITVALCETRQVSTVSQSEVAAMQLLGRAVFAIGYQVEGEPWLPLSAAEMDCGYELANSQHGNELIGVALRVSSYYLKTVFSPKGAIPPYVAELEKLGRSRFALGYLQVEAMSELATD